PCRAVHTARRPRPPQRTRKTGHPSCGCAIYVKRRLTSPRLGAGARYLDFLHLASAIVFYSEAFYEAQGQLRGELDVDGATGSGGNAGTAIVGLQEYLGKLTK